MQQIKEGVRLYAERVHGGDHDEPALGGPSQPPPPKAPIPYPSGMPIAFGCWCVEGCRRALCLRRRRGGMAATKSWPSCLLGWRCFLGTSCVGCGGEPTGKAPCHPPPPGGMHAGSFVAVDDY